MAARVPARLSPAQQGRRFGLTVGLAFLVLAAVLQWQGLPRGAAVPAVAGVALLLATILAPARLGPVERAWMRMALAISRVTTPIFMGIVYYGVITPTGALRRMMGKNSLVRRTAGSGYWVVREPGKRGSSLERQF
jgi:hypothetical protein